MNTAAEVARLTNLHVATVRRILRGENKETWAGARERAARVRKLAEELGYRCNASARATRTGRVGAIGLVLSDQPYRSDLPPALLSHLSQLLCERGLHLITAVLPDEKLVNEQFVPKLLGELACDGLMVNYHAHIPARLVQLIERHAVPAVWINAQREHDSVYPDDFAAARELTERLIAQGNRRVTYADTYFSNARAADIVHYSKVDRMAGYRDAMLGAGLAPAFWIPEGHDDVSSVRGLRTIASQGLESSDRPTAIVCYGAQDAAQLCVVAAGLGLRPGDDLRFATFGSETVVTGEQEALLARLPSQDVASAALEILDQKMQFPAKLLPSRREKFLIEDHSFVRPVGHEID